MRNGNGMTPGVAPSAYMEPDALIAPLGVGCELRKVVPRHTWLARVIRRIAMEAAIWYYTEHLMVYL